MKKVDLEKNKGLKINNSLNKAATPARFGEASTTVANRREQRKLDKERGLVPFAVKLPADLTRQLMARAQERNAPLNEVVADLLQRGLATDN